MSLICNFCKYELKTKSSLNYHQKNAKFCLKIQEKEQDKYKCNLCYKILSSKQRMESHKKICNIKREKDPEQLIREIREDNIKLKIQNENYKEQLKKQEENYKEQIKELQDKLERLLNKVIDRPTTTNNTINNKFELNSFPSQKEIDMKIESQFNDKYILDGMKGVAQFVYDHIVKLEDGSMAYACFDTSRQIFKYKDENGNEIKDPKAVKLRKMIKPGLLRQSQTLLDYFNDECDYLEKRKDVNGKEYNMMNTLREKAFEVGCDILSIEETNKFSNELANLSCV
jgi:hypothetical protein